MNIDKNTAALGLFGVVVAALSFSFIDQNTALGLFGVVVVTLIFLSLSRQIEQIGTKLRCWSAPSDLGYSAPSAGSLAQTHGRNWRAFAVQGK